MMTAKTELIERCINLIKEDMNIMNKERSFLRNLLMQMEIYQGLSTSEPHNSQEHNIKKLWTL